MRFLNDSNRLHSVGSIRVFHFLKLFENGEIPVPVHPAPHIKFRYVSPTSVLPIRLSFL